MIHLSELTCGSFGNEGKGFSVTVNVTTFWCILIRVESYRHNICAWIS